MKSLRILHIFPLLVIIVVAAGSGYAQDAPGSPTTFEDLYSRSDFIGWIRVTEQRYEEIPYKHAGSEAQRTIVTIYNFIVLDEVKRRPEVPNEFVSMGGEYQNGTRIDQSHEFYFQVGEEIFVHL